MKLIRDKICVPSAKPSFFLFRPFVLCTWHSIHAFIFLRSMTIQMVMCPVTREAAKGSRCCAFVVPTRIVHQHGFWMLVLLLLMAISAPLVDATTLVKPSLADNREIVEKKTLRDVSFNSGFINNNLSTEKSEDVELHLTHAEINTLDRLHDVKSTRALKADKGSRH